MIDAERFDLIRRKHGTYASWAVWAPPSSTPKSNVGDLWVLDERANPMLLETLNPGVVMVGLNFSRGSPYEPFQNFHDPRPEAHDFKIRFAFSGTPLWGAYMTDIIKSVVEPDSKALLKWLRRNPEVIMDHIDAFRQELSDLGHPRPMILAFGHAVYKLLIDNLQASEYACITKLMHYSNWISKDRYRDIVHRQLGLVRELPNNGMQPTAFGRG